MSQTPEVQATLTEADILGRLFANGGSLSPALARHILTLGFDDHDKARMTGLAGRNQEGTLSLKEQEELKSYAQAACLLGILHSKARLALKRSSDD